MSSFFITGTDTGVGKTLVGGAIAAALARAGKRVGVLKPCETGCLEKGGRLLPADALFLKSMAGCAEDLSIICPYCFRLPLAPLVAAEREGCCIEPGRIRAALQALQHGHDSVVVEGAGGLLVPIAPDVLTCDLIRILGLPVIIVSRLGLGTINHTLLTVRHAQARGIAVRGVILNQLAADRGLAEETNPEVIRRFCDVPVYGPMPFIAEENRGDRNRLAEAAAACIDLALLIS